MLQTAALTRIYTAGGGESEAAAGGVPRRARVHAAC